MENAKWVFIAAALGLALSYVIWGKSSSNASHSVDPKSKNGKYPEPKFKVEPPKTKDTKKKKTSSRLTITPSEFHLGELAPDTVKTMTATLKNTGDSSIKIEEVRTTCGCTKTNDLTKNLLAPGESVELHLEYKAERGKKSKDRADCLIQTNEPNKPVLTLPIFANIRFAFFLKPPLLDFGDLARNGEKTLKVSLVSSENKPFMLKTIGSSSGIKFSWDKSKPRKIFDITATIKAGDAPGRLGETVGLVTDDKLEKIVPLMVTANVIGNSALRIPHINQVVDKNKVLYPIPIEIYSTISDKEIKVTEVVDEGGRKVTFTENKGTHHFYKLLVQVEGAWKEGRDQMGALLIKTETEPYPLRFTYRVVHIDPKYIKDYRGLNFGKQNTKKPKKEITLPYSPPAQKK